MNRGDESFGHPKPDPDTGLIEVETALNYLAERCRKQRLAILTGPGVSQSANSFIWSRAEAELKRRLGKKNHEQGNMYHLAELYEDEMFRLYSDPDRARLALLQLLQDQMKKEHQNAASNQFGPVLEQLTQMPVFNYYTTNWDDLLPKALEPKSVLRLNNQNIRNEPTPAASFDEVTHVVYLHGLLEESHGSAIATSSDCYQYEILVPDLFKRLALQFSMNTTLLCLGCDFNDLNMLVYLSKALRGGNPQSGIYTLTPGTTAQEARVLLNEYEVRAIDCPLACDDHWTAAFLETLIPRIKGEQIPFQPPRIPPPTPMAEPEFPRMMRQAKRKQKGQGLASASEWFVEWPDPNQLKPELPPKHPLLDHMFVERDLRVGLKEGLKQGQTQGISGLLGIGGVGKSFLAMKVAWELIDQGWFVVWVGLLESGTEDGLNQLVDAYGLRFLKNLEMNEKVAAVHALCEAVSQAPNKTLVILDNAEKFPNLRLILEAVGDLPVLVTSRTEECRDLVAYQRIDSMNRQETGQLCRLFLDHFENDYYQTLKPEDHQDLETLCDYLGGHPLGIRLALAGFRRWPQEKREVNRPFKLFLDELRNNGMSGLKEHGLPHSGKAGEKLHQTISHTFDWLFRELPTVCQSHGEHAKLLLPLAAALGASPVSRADLRKALVALRDRILRETASPAIGKNLPAHAIESLKRLDPEPDRPNSLNLKSPQRMIGSFGIDQLSESSRHIKLPAHQLEVDRNYFLILLAGSVSLTRQEKHRIIISIHKLSQYQIDELIRILEEEKRKYSELDIKHKPQMRALEQKHAREWELLCREWAGPSLPKSSSGKSGKKISILSLNKSHFNNQSSWQELCLSQVRRKEPLPPDRKKLMDLINEFPKSQNTPALNKEEKRKESLKTILEPNPSQDLIPQPPKPEPERLKPDKQPEKPQWAILLEDLCEDEGFNRAIENLNDVSLIDGGIGGASLQVHPLIREFAFAERLGSPKGNRQLEGPSLEYIFSAALSVLSPTVEKSESFLDLVPRLRVAKSLAEQACHMIRRDHEFLYFKAGEWEHCVKFLEAGINLASSVGLKILEAEMKCKLGEILHRMEHERGLNLLRKGITLLEQLGREHHQRTLWWRSYIKRSEHVTELESHFLKLAKYFRNLLSTDHEQIGLLNYLEVLLREHMKQNCSSLQLGISSGGNNFLTNALFDLNNWIKRSTEVNTNRLFFKESTNLINTAQNRHKEESDIYVSITPQHRYDLGLSLVVSRYRTGQIDFQSFANEITKLLQEMRKAGFKGLEPVAELRFEAWRTAVLLEKWDELQELAEAWRESFAERVFSNQDYKLLFPELLQLLSTLVASNPGSHMEADSDHLLKSYFHKAERCGRDELAGWLLLCNAFLSIRKGYLHQAAVDLIQAKSAWVSRDLPLPDHVQKLIQYGILLINKERPIFEEVLKDLSAAERRPPDFTPWQLSPDDLPKRVRMKSDGKTMRLVKGGLQASPLGGEIWLYPFYIDETPVSALDFQQKCGLTNPDLVLGDPQNPITGISREMAQDYMTKTGKELPNSFEWYASKWQIAFGANPPRWGDWQTALAQVHIRIKTVIEGGLWEGTPRLPGHFRSLPITPSPTWIKKEIQSIFQGDWVPAFPGIQSGLERVRDNLSQLRGTPQSIEEALRASLLIPFSGKVSLDLCKQFLHERIPENTEKEIWAPVLNELEQAFPLEDADLEKNYSKLIRLQGELIKNFDQTGNQKTEPWPDYFLNLKWLEDSKLLNSRFHELMVRPLEKNLDETSAETSLKLARGLAASISLNLDEKKRIIETTDQLSEEQATELIKIFDKENTEFGSLNSDYKLSIIQLEHFRQLCQWFCQGEEVLFAVPIPGLTAYWSAQTSDENETKMLLEGDPFDHQGWHSGMVFSQSNGNALTTGLRGVLPVYTKSQLELIEPITPT